MIILQKQIILKSNFVKKVIEYAIDYARSLGHDYVGSEHILYGLFAETDGKASIILREVGIKQETLEQITKEILAPEDESKKAGSEQQEAQEQGYWKIPRSKMGLDSFLNAVGYRLDKGNLSKGDYKLGIKTSSLTIRIDYGFRSDEDFSRVDTEHVEEVIKLRNILDKNSVKYTENPPREKVAKALRNAGKKLSGLIDKLDIPVDQESQEE